MKQPQSHTTNVVSAVGLITLGTVNCAAGLNASHTLSPLMAGKRGGEKGGVATSKQPSEGAKLFISRVKTGNTQQKYSDYCV